MPVVASVPASPSTAMIDAGVAGKPGAAIDAGRSIDAVATSNRRTSDTSAAYARTAHTGTAKICSAHTGAAATEATRADTAVLRSALPPIDEWSTKREEARRERERLWADITARAQAGRRHETLLTAGQTAGGIREILPVAEIMRQLIAETTMALSRAPKQN